MGMGTGSSGGQVYFDAQTGQYYTQPSNNYSTNAQHPLLRGASMDYARTYIGNPTATQTPSPIDDLLAKAMAAKANVPTMNQLFSGMGNQGMMNYQAPASGQMNYGNPSYGAGRFLGANSIPLNMGSNTTT